MIRLDRRRACVALIVTAILAAAALASVSPIPQDPAYHGFADERPFLGIPRAGDVLSNMGFFVVGIVGIWRFLRRRDDSESADESVTRRLWIAFHLSLIATAFGSGWYHLAPDNERLAFDRLPMTFAFAAIFGAVAAERLGRRAGVSIASIALVVGVGSVVHWLLGERRGAGDLRPYAFAAFYPLLFGLPTLLLVRAGPARGARAWIMLYVGYALAKICEDRDAVIFEHLHFVSGHSLKHLFAALAVVPLSRPPAHAHRAP